MSYNKLYKLRTLINNNHKYLKYKTPFYFVQILSFFWQSTRFCLLYFLAHSAHAKQLIFFNCLWCGGAKGSTISKILDNPDFCNIGHEFFVFFFSSSVSNSIIAVNSRNVLMVESSHFINQRFSFHVCQSKV